jgi:hypothetical protein
VEGLVLEDCTGSRARELGCGSTGTVARERLVFVGGSMMEIGQDKW